MLRPLLGSIARLWQVRTVNAVPDIGMVMNKIQCVINDKPYEIEGVPPTMSLLHYLRDVLHLTGTKEGCNEGDCGACTVIFRDDTGEKPRYRAVNSCLIYLPMLHGKRI